MTDPEAPTARAVTYWGIAEVAEHLGITIASVYTYRTRGVLPEPDLVVGQSPAWLPETISAWNAARANRRASSLKTRTT